MLVQIVTYISSGICTTNCTRKKGKISIFYLTHVMESRGRVHRGRLRGNSRPPPVFDQHAFVVAMGPAATAIAKASAAGG